MGAPFSYVRFERSSSSTRQMATSIELAGKSGNMNNILCIGSSGLLDGPENDSEAVERTYSNGSVLAPTPRWAGLNFTLDFLIYSRNNSAVNPYGILEGLKPFFQGGNVTFKTSAGHNMLSQLQRISIQEENWIGNPILIVRMFFKSA